MLSNAYFLVKFRFDTAENEHAKNLQNFAKFANYADPNLLRRRAGARAARVPGSWGGEAPRAVSLTQGLGQKKEKK